MAQQASRRALIIAALLCCLAICAPTRGAAADAGGSPYPPKQRSVNGAIQDAAIAQKEVALTRAVFGPEAAKKAQAYNAAQQTQVTPTNPKIGLPNPQGTVTRFAIPWATASTFRNLGDGTAVKTLATTPFKTTSPKSGGVDPVKGRVGKDATSADFFKAWGRKLLGPLLFPPLPLPPLPGTTQINLGPQFIVAPLSKVNGKRKRA